jgi:hypothetical protein
MQIKITVGSITLDAELNDTPTARKIAAILPFKGGFNTWGDEIYFGIPVEASLDETAQEVVQVGDLGYWPTGNAFCVFFGPTPASTGEEIRPASAVNMIGRVLGDATLLKDVMNEEEVSLEAA